MAVKERGKILFYIKFNRNMLSMITMMTHGDTMVHGDGAWVQLVNEFIKDDANGLNRAGQYLSPSPGPAFWW